MYLAAGIGRYVVVDLRTQRFVMQERTPEADTPGAQAGWFVSLHRTDEPLHLDIGAAVTLTL